MRTLKTILMSGMIGLGALATNGCETMNDSDAAAVGLALLSGLPQGGTETIQQAMNRQLLAGVASNYAAQAGQRQFQQQQTNEIAGGLNNIGQAIQNSQNQQPTIQQVVQQQPLTYEDQIKKNYNQGQNMVFPCNYRMDFNGNGVMEADEFVGIKRSFRKDEKISLVCITHSDLNGKLVEQKILDSNGDLVGLNRDYLGNVNQQSCVFDYQIIPQALKSGSYTTIFSAEGQYLGKTEFEVSD